MILAKTFYTNKILQNKKLLALFALISVCCFAKAQSNWNYKGQVNFGCNIVFNYSKGQKFPGLKIFGGFSATAVYKNHLLLNYGPSLAIYTKSLGANLNPLVGDIQIDFTNSFSVGGGWDDLSYTKFFRTLNNAPYYNIAIDKSYAILLTTNFILNNHKRNQAVGSITLSAPGVTINYYNDGAPPFEWLALGDNFDRWWTGGLGVFFHNRKGYNNAEFSFDQFTGYSPLLYELSTLLGINVPSYNKAERNSTEKIPPSFNTSAYNLKIFLDKGYAVDIGVIGSLIDKNGKAYGLQDIIHVIGGYALHPNNDINRFYIGGTYNNLKNVKLQ